MFSEFADRQHTNGAQCKYFNDGLLAKLSTNGSQYATGDGQLPANLHQILSS